jgi:hypothetical protein
LRLVGDGADGTRREEPAGQPHDQDGLSGAYDGAGGAIDGTQDAVAQRVGERAADCRAEPLAQPDGEEQTQQDDQRAGGRVERAEDLLEPGQGEEGERPASDRAGQPADLGQRPRPEPEGHADDEQHDGGRVEQVHRPIVAYPPPGGARAFVGPAGPARPARPAPAVERLSRS